MEQRGPATNISGFVLPLWTAISAIDAARRWERAVSGKDKGTGEGLMATKGASVKFIEAALAKMERELEDTQGPRKETLQKLIARVYPLLRALGRQTLH